ncbi:MAG TPA: hypothetical protein VII13_03800 [Vicinamibacteria bacterium]
MKGFALGAVDDITKPISSPAAGVDSTPTSWTPSAPWARSS